MHKSAYKQGDKLWVETSGRKLKRDTDHHSLQLHAVGWNNAASKLERLLQILLARFSYACQFYRQRYTFTLTGQ